VNIADQRHLEYEIIKQEPNIRIERCTLLELNANGHLNDEKTLFYKEYEVSIVYYRAGYSPEHYQSEKEWNALLKIEMSRAIKCPNLGTFLAGMKKVQEFISHENNLLELCDNNQDLTDSLKSVFAEFFRLDNEVFFFKTVKKYLKKNLENI
jgi:glutathione synthase